MGSIILWVVSMGRGGKQALQMQNSSTPALRGGRGRPYEEKSISQGRLAQTDSSFLCPEEKRAREITKRPEKKKRGHDDP